MKIRKLLWFSLLFFFANSGCVGLSGGNVVSKEIWEKAKQGDAASQFRLGLAYDQGQGLNVNKTEAVFWYRKSAEQGFAVAQNSLGSMYQYGDGIPKDYSEAARWYQEAADQNHGEANTNLGYMYDGGIGVTQDKEKAVELYLIGAERDSLNAMLNLGVSYWKGEGTSTDLVQAYMWLDLARFYAQRSPNMNFKWRVRAALDEIKKEMTTEEIKMAEGLTREWDAAHRAK